MRALLEREDELGVLDGALEQAIQGHGSLVLVAGEAGIGKTSLIRLLQANLPEGVRFATGACEPLSVPVPLAPWRELAEAMGDGGRAFEGVEDRLVLASSLLQTMVAETPGVVVVEDAHWADPLSLDVLRILSRRFEQNALLMVVTYRDDEVAANPALGLLLGDLASNPSIRRVTLGPLSDRAVEVLAAGSGLDGRQLLAATRGNPFLLTETIAAGGRLPASVRDAALARAGRLSRAAREVVDVAAVVGQRFDVSLLNALVSDPREALDEALARGVLVAEGTALGFRHELIREALEQSMSPLRRAELHARVLAALAARPEGADQARLAHHAELGGLSDEASRYAVAAAREAEQLGALHEARLQAERALRLGHALDRSDRFELLVQYSRTANFTNARLEDGADAARQALTLAEELADEHRRGRAWMVLASALWSLERVVDAREAAEQAVRAFQPPGDVASLAWAYATLIRMEATSFDPAAAVAMAPEAVRAARAAGLDEVGLDVSISVALARGHLGQAEALDDLMGALAEARRRGWTIRMVRTYVNLITVAVALRRHGVVDQIGSEAGPVLEDLHVSPLPIAAIRLSRARSLLDRGRWDEALPLARDRQRWWLGEFPVACAMEGLIRARRGEPQGTELLDTAWEQMVTLVGPESSRHLMLRATLIEGAWLRGDHFRALAELRAAHGSLAYGRFVRPTAEVALWGARLGVELEVPQETPAPVQLELAGDWRGAVRAWRELEAPYEAALAALPGDDRAAREAVSTLQRLGALGAAEAFGRERTARGARPVRGARRSTRLHPAGLTRREQEVLEALETGASNAEVAAQLHLSERTVAHHVSAILGKLEAPNRHEAVARARGLGLLGEPTR